MEIEGSTCEYAEKSEIVSIAQPPFTVTLHKTFIQGALYRVEGSDTEDKYELILLLSHFNGQECKDYISSCPKFIEKLFQSKLCRILTKDSQMICQFDGDILSATITLQKIIEPPFEALMTTVKKQEKKIAELQEENKQLERKIRQELKDSSILRTLSSQVQQLENTIKKQENEHKQFNQKFQQTQTDVLQILSSRVQQLENTVKKQETKNIQLDQKLQQTLNDSRMLQTLSSKVQQLESTVKQQEKEISQLKDENKQLDHMIEDRSKNSDQFSHRIRQLEKSYSEEMKKTVESLNIRVKNLEEGAKDKNSLIPSRIFGIWSWEHGKIFVSSENNFSVYLNHSAGGGKCKITSDPKWANGKFSWSCRYEGNSCSAVSNDVLTFTYDPDKPDTMIETYDGNTGIVKGTNTFTKMP